MLTRKNVALNIPGAALNKQVLTRMFYVLTIVVPIAIVVLCHFVFKKPRNFVGVLNWILKTFPIFLLYSFLLYILEYKEYINTSWTFYTIWFFSIIIYPIVTAIRLILYFYQVKHKNK